MRLKSTTLAFSLALTVGAAGSALADGTYVYADGGTKDFYAGIPVPAPIPVPMQEAKWYLRFDVGGSFVGDVSTSVRGGGLIPRSADEIPTSVFGEVGFGYQFSPSFRMDFTTNFHDPYSLSDPRVQSFQASITVDDPGNPGETLTNDYDVTRTDEVRIRRQSTNLVNFYYDFANSSRFTPHVGFGVGVTYVNTDREVVEDAQCTGATSSVTGPQPACFVSAGGDRIQTASVEEEHEWLFSGALMAGFTYDINESFAIDAGYRVVYSPGEINRSAPTLNAESVGSWEDFLHHQFRTGLRVKIF